MISPSSEPLVTAVVVTYNRKELLAEAIQALLSQDYTNCNILIIDNASTDGTDRLVKKQFAQELKSNKIIYYKSERNLGGAGGFNIGLKKAVQLKTDFVWVMDDDCIVHKDSLIELLKADKKFHGNYGFLSSKVLWKDGTVCKMNIPKKTFATWLKDFDTNYQKIAMASFVSLFIPCQNIKEYGLPIADFFIWTDDWEYTRRLSRAKKCYYVSSSVVTHKSSSNLGANIDTAEDDRIDRFKYLYRNDAVLYRREGIRGAILSKLRIFIHKRRLKKSNLSKTEKQKRLTIINDAIKTGRKFRPSIEYPQTNLLLALGETFYRGGQESFLLNVYNYLDHEKYNCDFFTAFKLDNDAAQDCLNENKNVIYHYDMPFKRFTKNITFLIKFSKHLSKHHYDIVHINSCSTFCLAMGAICCKKHKVEKVLVESHSSGLPSFRHSVVIKLFGPFWKKADYVLGCSDSAAKYRYPTGQKYDIINNGIQVQKYSFNTATRKKCRKQLGIKPDEYVIGNIGRFETQKNHGFILEVFSEILKNNPNSKLLLIGEGSLKNNIIEKAQQLNIWDKVILLEKRNDIPELLQAMDVFFFPSLYEGFSIAAIEAQASGLPIVFSSTLGKEVGIISQSTMVNLKADKKKWAKEVMKYYGCSRSDQSETVAKAGYGLNFEKLVTLYEK
ncbi:glycosyltransferase [Candidatus Saccharibacteria bacterium]|nr:glycosyltransferase [Candidatus Saccharibacteria bacterium]